MQVHIITIFPQMLTAAFADSILKRAQDAGHVNITIHNLRDWTTDSRKTVDDTPYGGGAGMVIMFEPFYKAINEIKKNLIGTTRVILTSAKGETFSQPKAQEYSKLDNLIILAGHYEGVDERINEFLVDEEVSIGNYVLTGGEIPAMVITDSVVRLIPGVLGNKDSLESESHNTKNLLEYPQYTKPEHFKTNEGKTLSVPPVLLSGNHKKIAQWRIDNQKLNQ